jgi:DNA-directed RNA polymerase sigma subunit (sigma70/sigma32)
MTTLFSTEADTEFEDPLPGTSDTTPNERSELIEALDAMLLQQRLVTFVLELDDDERTIVEHRVLSSRPQSLAKLSRMLGWSPRRTSAKVRELEARLRQALTEPVRQVA